MTEIALTSWRTRSVKRPQRVRRPGLPRAFDLASGLVLLLLAAPVMLLVAACIWAEDGGPVFFVQQRLGREGRPFGCIKFRSMATDAQARFDALMRSSPEARELWAKNRKLRHDPRVTRVGRFIRRRSLDELPQLINVVLGQMSVVGPRPIMMDEVGLYGRRIAVYAKVRPGLTGLWQVRGRGDASFRSRIAMDMVYIRARSALLDLKILALTIPVVLLSRGSY